VAKKTNDTNVTRIKASDGGSSKKTKSTNEAKSVTRVKTKTKTLQSAARPDDSDSSSFLSAFFGYFRGAWYELRQVRWPTRGATWSLTGAVLAFSAFFIIFILLIDAGFKYLFEQLLK